MKVRLALLVALMAVAAPTWAAGGSVEELSKQTGVSQRHVRMILGTRTSYAEYPYTYERELKRFKAGIGEGNYRRLMSGQPIVLPNGEKVQIRVASN
jgi:heme/copper-type cytochrome/quinol oxidase subunit 2